MSEYNLKSDEIVIVELENVMLENHSLFVQNGKLVLTNYNLIWLGQKLLSGGYKLVTKYPLSTIKVYNGKAQIRIDEKKGNLFTIYFINQEVKYRTNEKERLRIFANSINKILTGSEEELIQSTYVTGVKFLAETIKGTTEIFKDAFGIKNKEPEKIVSRCCMCSAPVCGGRGQIVKCQYCGTEQRL